MTDTRIIVATAEQLRRAAILLRDYDLHFHNNITAQALAYEFEEMVANA